MEEFSKGKTILNIDSVDKELIRTLVLHLENLTDQFQQIAIDQIDSLDEIAAPMREQAKSALIQQYDVFRFILKTVVVIDSAPENEIPS